MTGSVRPRDFVLLLTAIPIQSKEISHNLFVARTLPVTPMSAGLYARSCDKAFVFRMGGGGTHHKR